MLFDSKRHYELETSKFALSWPLHKLHVIIFVSLFVFFTLRILHF